MTRYLPNASGTLDLKLHLESLGHSPNLLNSLVLTSNNLRGQLTKLASRKKRRPWQRWQNRWILFDRVTRSLQWFRSDFVYSKSGKSLNLREYFLIEPIQQKRVFQLPIKVATNFRNLKLIFFSIKSSNCVER